MRRLLYQCIQVALSLCLIGCATIQGDWRKAQEQDTINAYKRFLKEHPSTEFSDIAEQRIEEGDWRKAQEQDTIAAYSRFLKEHPNTEFSDTAKQRLGERWQLLAESDWEKAKTTNTMKSYQQFVAKHSSSSRPATRRLLDDAVDAIMTLDWESAKKTNLIKNYQQFLEMYPNRRYSVLANAAITQIEMQKEKEVYQAVVKSRSRTKLQAFLKMYPGSDYKEAVEKRLAEFSTKTIIIPLIVPYNAFRLKGPVSGAEAERKGKELLKGLSSTSFISRNTGGFVTNDVIILHEGETLPTNSGFDISAGKLLIKPLNSGFIQVTSLDSKGFCVLDFHLLLPVGTEIRVPQNEWVQWGNIELKGGKMRLLETGIELSGGTEVTSIDD